MGVEYKLRLCLALTPNSSSLTLQPPVSHPKFPFPSFPSFIYIFPLVKLIIIVPLSNQMQESPSKKKKLAIEDYDIKDRLGRGAYGEVYEAIRKDNLQKCALKQIQKKLLGREEKQYQALVQRELLSKIEHPGIIKILASFQDPNNLYFSLELCEGGEFKHFLQLTKGKLGPDAFRFYAAEIVNTLEYLHKNGITHRDLKPQNIMISKQGHLKLIDFGTAEFSQSTLVAESFKERIESQKKGKAKKYQEDSEETKDELSKNDLEEEYAKIGRRSTFVGTSYYISPELLESNICEPPSDLWALGCILYQFYYGKTPFADCQQFLVFEKIKNLEYHFPPLPSGDPIPPETKDLIMKLLVKEPYKRIGAKDYNDLKSHKFFENIDIDKIFLTKAPQFGQKDSICELSDESERETPAKSQMSDKTSEKSSTKTDSLTGTGSSLIHGMVQKRSFLIYVDIYMTLSNSGAITMCRPQNLDKRKVVHLQTDNKVPAELLQKNKFSVATLQKKYVIKAQNAEAWVKKINEKAQLRKPST